MRVSRSGHRVVEDTRPTDASTLQAHPSVAPPRSTLQGVSCYACETGTRVVDFISRRAVSTIRLNFHSRCALTAGMENVTRALHSWRTWCNVVWTNQPPRLVVTSARWTSFRGVGLGWTGLNSAPAPGTYAYPFCMKNW